LNIQNVIFEPVGTIANFTLDSLLMMSKSLSCQGDQTKDRKRRQEKVFDASEIYWNIVQQMRQSSIDLSISQRELVAKVELDAVAQATQCDDVVIALKELRELGVKLHIASMLSNDSVARIVEKFSLRPSFAHTCGVGLTSSGGANPLKELFVRGNIREGESVFLADHHFGSRIAFEANTPFMLMMNDYEHARLAVEDGCYAGVASLLELPLAVRLLNERQ
jgi:phosphoglycolate phosphatase-like HAD superfamily hydrolase